MKTKNILFIALVFSAMITFILLAFGNAKLGTSMAIVSVALWLFEYSSQESKSCDF